MVNREMLKGSWLEVCGKLREKWGELDEDQLERFEGRAKRLVGYIHRKTGEAEEKIEHYLDDILAELGNGARHRPFHFGACLPHDSLSQTPGAGRRAACPRRLRKGRRPDPRAATHHGSPRLRHRHLGRPLPLGDRAAPQRPRLATRELAT